MDIFAVVATVFGIATTLGLGASQMNTGLDWLFGIGVTPTTQLVIIADSTGFCGCAASPVTPSIWLHSAESDVASVLVAAHGVWPKTRRGWSTRCGKLADLERFYTLYQESSRDVLERLKSQASEDGA